MPTPIRKGQQQVLDFLRNHGATDLRVEQGGKHMRLCFLFNGKEHFKPLSRGTGALEPRAIKNTIADLKRKLGPPSK